MVVELELISILLVVGVERVKKMLFPILRDGVIVIDLVVVLWVCEDHEKSFILLIYTCIILAIDLLKTVKNLMLDMAEASVYKKMQKLRMKILEDVLKTLDEDENHENS